MDKLRTITGFNADDLLNKSGLLTQHENIKSLDKDLLYEKSNELKRHELPDIDLSKQSDQLFVRPRNRSWE